VKYLGEALEHDLGVFCHDLAFKKSYVAVHSDRQSSAVSQSLSLTHTHTPTPIPSKPYMRFIAIVS
jgi:hypothetical protein